MHLSESYYFLPNQQIWLVMMFAVSGFALWRGGKPERMVAISNVLAWFLTPIAQNHQDLFDPQWGMLGVDVAFLAVLLGMALRYDRVWLLFATAFQLLGVVIHLAIVVDPSLRSLVYLRGLVIWSYMVLASLAAGSLAAAKRARRPALSTGG